MQFFETTSQQTGACGNHFLSMKELFSLCLEKKCFLICFFVKKGICLPNTYKRVTYKVTVDRGIIQIEAKPELAREKH
ncbi:hypothetical protein DXA67_05390 [Bacteroides fragilis]|jgi:hypothetical protein|nr:hypothetical protein DXB57_06935 [Bacteroides fragilis]RGX89326.1 hypothetical protein DXA67_05390 [Bacteroides fragilis]